jgi:membrane protease YdiL (CAAX protease family)
MHLALMLAVILALLPAASRRPWQYGLALPKGKIWWGLLPVAILAGLAGGIVLPTLPSATQPEWSIGLIGVLAMPVGLELLFRSLVHGLLAQKTRIGRPKMRPFVSWPIIGSALLFAGYIVWQKTSGTALDQVLANPLLYVQPALGAFLLGLLLGIARERSLSIIPPILFHITAAGAVLAAVTFAF